MSGELETVRAEAKSLGIEVDGRWSVSRIESLINSEKILRENDPNKHASAVAVGAMEEAAAKIEGQDVPEEVNKFTTLEWANERAALIWSGQSPNLSILERVGRIKLGLGDKGFTNFKSLILPTKLDYKRYL